MFLDINSLGPEGLLFDQELEAEALDSRPGGALDLVVGRIRGRAGVGGRGIELEGEVEATVRATCSRCAETFPWELATRFFLVAIPGDDPGAGSGELEVGEDDADLLFAPGGTVDLREIAREQVLLNLPLKPVCKGDCKGLCPVCGNNRNQEPCGCQVDAPDPRLAPLLDIKKRLNP